MGCQNCDTGREPVMCMTCAVELSDRVVDHELRRLRQQRDELRGALSQLVREINRSHLSIASFHVVNAVARARTVLVATGDEGSDG